MTLTKDEWLSLKVALKRVFNEKQMHKAQLEIDLLAPQDVGVTLAEEKPAPPNKPEKLTLPKRSWTGALTK